MWCGKIPFCLLLAGVTLLPTMENRAVPHRPALPCLALSPCSEKDSSRFSWPERGSKRRSEGAKRASGEHRSPASIHPSPLKPPYGVHQGVWCAEAVGRPYRLTFLLPRCWARYHSMGSFTSFWGFIHFPYAPNRMPASSLIFCYAVAGS